MKIGNSTEQAELAAAALRTASESSKAKTTEVKGTEAAADQASSKVQISSAAAALKTEESTSVFDAEKVARMQEAIANGTYVISPEGIASKLISNAKEVLANARAAQSNG